MNIAERLIQLGYKVYDGVSDDYDFACQDDGDGPFVSEWRPEEPIPDVSDVEVRDVPKKVSQAQALLALDQAGILDEVDAIIDAHPVRAVMIWYDNANEWYRNHPYIEALRLELDLTDEHVDELFILANSF